MKLLSFTIFVLWFLAIKGEQQLEFNKEDSLVYAVASALAYWPAKKIMDHDWQLASELAKKHDLVPIHAFQNDEPINSIVFTVLHRKDQDEIIIAFSGTENNQQLINEMKNGFPVDYVIHPDIEGAKVVQYFYSFYVKFFREDLEHYLENHLKVHPNDTVVFTGHSLGGAMSMHAATDAILSDWVHHEKIVTHTFGQPRVGNINFSNILDKARASFRVIHDKDIVPNLPPWITDLRSGCFSEGILPFYPYHAHQEVWFEQGMETYKVCDPEEGEDRTCSDKAYSWSVDDHLYYYGLNIGGLFLQNSTMPINVSE